MPFEEEETYSHQSPVRHEKVSPLEGLQQRKVLLQDCIGLPVDQVLLFEGLVCQYSPMVHFLK